MSPIPGGGTARALVEHHAFDRDIIALIAVNAIGPGQQPA